VRAVDDHVHDPAFGEMIAEVTVAGNQLLLLVGRLGGFCVKCCFDLVVVDNDAYNQISVVDG
jgi:hypothetical protein